MKKHLVGMALSKSNGFSVADGFRMLREHGFETTFFGWDHENMTFYAREAEKNGLILTSIHAPFARNNLAAALWRDDETGNEAERMLFSCLDDCVRIHVPVMVVHPYIGFLDEYRPTDVGVARFRRLAEEADRVGVRLAVENVEGEPFFDLLMKEFAGCPSVGFCLDTGHMYCYNHGRDFLTEYGDRLAYLHINSNMGVTSPDGKIFWTDDAHMLPFDGVADMELLAKRLRAVGYEGDLMMELIRKSHEGRTTNDAYAAMSDDDYLSLAYERICRLRDLVDGEEN